MALAAQSHRTRKDRAVNELLKWRQTILISVSKQLAYKTNFILLVLGPVTMFFLIKYNLWTSIFTFREIPQIGGYTLREMISYQGWVLVVALIAQGYNSRNLSEDIRLGRISTYLIYPFDFWQYHFASFLGFQSLQLTIAGLSILVLAALGVLGSLSLTQILLGILISILAGMLWYLAQYAVGLLAFWLDETWTLRVILIIFANFASGAIIPLELFPEWARTIALYSPFPYLTYVPVKTFMGQPLDLPLHPVLALIIWSFVVWMLGQIIWRRGIRLYSAAGM
jgi:ABC-2 type transport system permease protein